MKISIHAWLKISLFNILAVALLGVLMRFKIGFEFPFLEQKYIQLAHSHFAFSGWITQTILVLLAYFIRNYIPGTAFNKYAYLLMGNLVCSYGILVSFFIRGYGTSSIFFSVAAILVSWLFAYFFLKDLKHVGQNHPSRNWFKAALWFNILSSAGIFAIAYMMLNKSIVQNLYLASLYFYLHFQYNGWFFFACFGLAIMKIHEADLYFKFHKGIFALFACACVPAYFLSILWLSIPLAIYILVILAAASQLIAWTVWIMQLRRLVAKLKPGILKTGRVLFILVGISVSIKLILQMVSTVPAISDLAFGFRPIVIAYLHLVLLAITSMFLLSYMHVFTHIGVTAPGRISLVIFACGVFLNEIALTIQGTASFSYTIIPYINEMLFGISILMFLALLFLLIFHAKRMKVM